MIMLIQVICIAASFVVRNPNSVLGGGWRRFVHLKVFVQRVTRRISPARYKRRETPDADSTRGFVNSGASTIRGVDRDDVCF